MWIRISCLVVFALSAGCGGADRNLTSLFGSADAIDTVRNASSVTAYRLKSPATDHRLLSDYEMTAGPISVSDASTAELRAMLLDSSLYRWDTAKGCEPDFGVRIRFQRGNDAVDVLFCFDCDILGVYDNGVAVGGEDFDDFRNRLLVIVKDMFPDDEAIQSLE